MSPEHEPTERNDEHDDNEVHEDLAPEEPVVDETPAPLGGPIELEDPVADTPVATPSLADSLDVCPNCGASMRNIDTLVCLRCGYDFKSMRVIETVTKEDAVEEPNEEGDEEEDTTPLVVSGIGGWRLPIVITIIAAMALVIGYLVGYRGLFPHLILPEDEGPTVITWGDRFEMIGHMIALLSLWTICGIGALLTCSWLFGRPLGDARMALCRMLAMVTVAQALSYVSLGGGPWERIAEIVGAAALFALLSMILLRLRPRDAATLVGIMIVAFVVLFGLSHLVVWVT